MNHSMKPATPEEANRRKVVSALVNFAGVAGLWQEVQATDFHIDFEVRDGLRDLVASAMELVEKAEFTPSRAYMARNDTTLQKVLARCAKRTRIARSRKQGAN